MDLFNFIKNNVDILSTIGEYTSLKKTGSLYWKGRCPFHHEKTGSFTVSPHKNIFYCFGCHATGDVINFIEKIEHLSAYEAAQHLVQRYHLEVPQQLQQSSGAPLAKTYHQLCYSVATWCSNMLTKHPLALEYISKRSITASTISQFLIGFFPSGSRNIQNLISFVAQDGFSSKDLIEANILMQGKQGLYCPYENRILFPIKDLLGNVCGFGGRVFLPEDTRAKYYNSMESVHFKKGKILFGFDIAKHEIQAKKCAILVEGYMDAIALWQSGIKNVVATLGTAASTEHLQQLSRYAQTIYLLYDADQAGKQAVVRVAPLCWQLDLELKVITLPEQHDPASMLEEKLNIQTYIDQAQDIFNFMIDAKSVHFGQDSMKNKMTTVHELLEIIRQAHDSLKQNILLMKASESLQIPLEILKNEYTKKYSRNQNDSLQEPFLPPAQKTDTTEQNISALAQLEDQIIAAILQNPHLMTSHHEVLLTSCLSGTALKVVESIIQHRTQEHVEICQHSIEEMIDPAMHEYARSTMFKLHDNSDAHTFQGLMLQIQKKYWKSITSTIKIKIMQAKKSHNQQEVNRLLEVFEQLKLEVYKNGRL